MAAVYFSRAAEHDLKRLPSEAIEKLRAKHVSSLAANPRAGKSLRGPLRGFFSYDFHSSGISYRIAYELIKSDVIILMIGSRDNFYKKLTRRVR